MNVNTATTTALPLEVDCDELARKLPQLLGEERSVQTSFLLHLAAFDRARGYERFGYAQLWDYCRQELGLLEGATFRRVHAARLLDRYPQAREMLLYGRLYMTTLVLLEKIITAENADELFALAAGKSKAEVDYLVACRLRPATATATGAEPVRAAVIRRVRAAESTAAEVPDLFAARPVGVPLPTPAMVQPVAEDRFTIKLTVSKAFVDALAEAKLVLSHRVPGGEVEAVLRAALDELIARDAKRNGPKAKEKERAAVVEAKVVDRGAPSPQPPPAGRGGRMATSSSASRSRSVPAAVRRAVWARDGGCCAWAKADGTSCGSRWQLELDHVIAFALGGRSSVENLRLLCSLCRARHKRHYSARRIMPRSSRRATVVTALYAA